MMQNLKLLSALFVLFCFYVVNTNAHDKETMAKMKTPHNGQAVMVNQYHLEMVLIKDAIQIYVTDHFWEPQSIQGAEGEIVVMTDNHKEKMMIRPKRENMLVANGSYHKAKNMKVQLSLKIPDQPMLSAEFEPMTKMGGESSLGDAHKHHQMNH